MNVGVKSSLSEYSNLPYPGTKNSSKSLEKYVCSNKNCKIQIVDNEPLEVLDGGRIIWETWMSHNFFDFVWSLGLNKIDYILMYHLFRKDSLWIKFILKISYKIQKTANILKNIKIEFQKIVFSILCLLCLETSEVLDTSFYTKKWVHNMTKLKKRQLSLKRFMKQHKTKKYKFQTPD
jgi:hypothetical protein